MSANKNKIYRIVLTGGASGGKSSSLSHIKDYFSNLGFNVFLVPEAATLMILGGVQLLQDDVLEKQYRLIELQKYLEHTFLAIAHKSNKPSIIICDRGMMDNKAFVSEEIWKDVLKLIDWTEVELRDHGYEAVLHLVTAADGAEEFYTLENNKARSESLEQARILDQKIQDAWLGHPHLRVIDNSTDFEGKIKRVIAAICNVVGIPEPIENERKFLVESIDWNEFNKIKKEIVDIEQIYLIAIRGESRVRKRGQNNSFTYTHTTKHNISTGKRIEKERIISKKEYDELLKEADYTRKVIKKQRHCFLWKNQYFELDLFLESNGLWLLELEIENDDHKIELPPFLKINREVTDEKEFKNSEIAKIK